MPRPISVPSYRLHKPTGQAVVTIRQANGSRRDLYLGKHNSLDSRREYARVIAELTANPTASQTTAQAASKNTVDQMLLPFWRHVEQHYRDPDGNPTTEVKEIKVSITPLRELYGQN